MGIIRHAKRRRGVVAVVADEVTDEQKAVYFDELANQYEYSPKEACQKAGITRAQFDHLQKTDKDFVARTLEFKGSLIEQIEDRAMRQALLGDGAMIRFVLQAEKPGKYGNKSKLDITHRIQSPLDLRNLSDEEFAEVQKQIEGECPAP